MNPLKPPAVRWLFWCCAASVLYLALARTPGPTLSSWDKINHVIAFLVLQGLGGRSWSGRVHVVALGLMGYGVVIELLQSLTPNRYAEWEDVVANMVGIVLALAGTHALRQFRGRHG